MNFRDTLQPASFRGVPFHVSSSETSVGRRMVVHEFPLSDTPQAEDLGRRPNEFTLDGFLIGDDYIDQMKRLIGALTAPGPGTLVHPSRGTMQVVLPYPSRLREGFIEKRGMVAFSLVFLDVTKAEQLSFAAATDTQQVVEDKADAAYDPCGGAFVKKMTVAGAPDWSVGSLVSEINRVSDKIAQVRDGMGLNLTALSSITRSAAQFKFNLTTLLNKPADLANALISQVRSLTDLFDFNAPRGISAFSASRYTKGPLTAMLGLATYGLAGTATARPAVPQNGTAARAQQASNQEAVFALVRQAAVIEAARAVVFQPFPSFDDAAAVRDAIYDAIDAQLLDAPDPVYQALVDVRVAVVADIAVRGLDLTRLATVTLQESVPATVLAYRLYGNTAYAAELVERNNILNPLIMPGGVPLEVRSV